MLGRHCSSQHSGIEAAGTIPQAAQIKVSSMATNFSAWCNCPQGCSLVSPALLQRATRLHMDSSRLLPAVSILQGHFGIADVR